MEGLTGISGKDWLYGFMRRPPDIVLWKLQETSIARATSFNRHNVKMFYDQLKDVADRFHIELQNIWSMNESALTTVQKPNAVLAQRGVRNLGAIKSAVLVTLALAASEDGVCIVRR